jgi:hypothetical protein
MGCVSSYRIAGSGCQEIHSAFDVAGDAPMVDACPWILRALRAIAEVFRLSRSIQKIAARNLQGTNA